MIDLIIPYYKNKQGIIDTLNSINFDIFEVTVVDDASEEEYDLDYPIHYILNEVNSGPGNARQNGIQHTSNDYIMFIDNDGEDHYIFSKVSEDSKPVFVDRALSNLLNDGYEVFANPDKWSYLDELAFSEEEESVDDSMAAFNQLKEEQENHNEEI